MRKLIKVLDHLVNAADEVAYLGAAGLVKFPSKILLLDLKRLWSWEMGYEVLHHQLIIYVLLYPSLWSLLLEHSQELSDNQVPRHNELMGSRG